MKFESKKSEVPEPDMTPMIDIVFQLIAFFMLVTNFDQAQADERVILPADQLAKPPKVAREDEILINIGYIRNLDGEKVDPDPFIFQGNNQIRIQNYGPYLKSESQLAVAKRGKEAPKEIAVIIRADSEVPFGMIQELIKEAQKYKFEKFSLKAMVDNQDG